MAEQHSGFEVLGDIEASADNTHDLGATTVRFQDLYLAGNITDDVNTVTVANIRAAYDHSLDNTQAHTDYMLNTGDTAAGNYTFNGATMRIYDGNIGYTTLRIGRISSNANQFFGLVGQHAVAAEEPMAVIMGESVTGTVNNIFIGGCTGSGCNAATKIIFQTAATNTTLDGTLRMSIDNTGAVDVTGDFTAGTIQADDGFTGSWVNAEGDTVTVVGGIITDVS